jgi:hypothetical protein
MDDGIWLYKVTPKNPKTTFIIYNVLLEKFGWGINHLCFVGNIKYK